MNPNDNYLTNPSVVIINKALKLFVNRFTTKRHPFEISSYSFTKQKHPFCKCIIEETKNTNKEFEVYSENQIVSVIYNTLINCNYLTQVGDKYYLTEAGYRYGLKSLKPLLYFHRYYWKSYIPITISTFALIVSVYALTNNKTGDTQANCNNNSYQVKPVSNIHKDSPK
ncbi:hypothetical protein [Thalassotalea agariperforans]